MVWAALDPETLSSITNHRHWRLFFCFFFPLLIFEKKSIRTADEYDGIRSGSRAWDSSRRVRVASPVTVSNQTFSFFAFTDSGIEFLRRLTNLKEYRDFYRGCFITRGRGGNKYIIILKIIKHIVLMRTNYYYFFYIYIYCRLKLFIRQFSNEPRRVILFTIKPSHCAFFYTSNLFFPYPPVVCMLRFELCDFVYTSTGIVFNTLKIFGCDA